MVEAAQIVRDNIIKYIIDPAMMVLFTAGFLLFVYGIVEFMYDMAKGGSAGKQGKDHMLWGVLGMVVMSSVWGIIALIDNTFGLGLGDYRNPNINTNQLPNIQNIEFR